MDQRGHLGHVARTGLNHQGVRPRVGNDGHGGSETLPGPIGVELLDRVGCGGGRSELEAEDLELRVRRDRLVEPFDQFQNGLYVLRPADDQHGIGRDHRRHADVALPRRHRLRRRAAAAGRPVPGS